MGKSTLFNRLVRRRRAIVEDTPGVTRDRHYADATLDDRNITLIDTGGFETQKTSEPLAEPIRLQAQVAMEECDVIVLVVDGRAGVTSTERELANLLRAQPKPVLLVVNKVDQVKKADEAVADFFALGLGEPLAVSAEHNLGLEALSQGIQAALPPAPEVTEEPDDENRPVRVALVGRPNVGKSLLLNALLNEERAISSPLAGTTRDSTESQLSFQGKPIVLVDTAGIRKKSAVAQRVEQFAVFGALRAVEDADVVVLVLDATEAGVDQDLKIASLAVEKGRSLLLVVNKWDLLRGKAKEEDFRQSLKWYMQSTSWAPMVFVSAKENWKTQKILERAVELFEQQNFRAKTSMLNKVLEHITNEHPLPVIKGKALKLYYIAQVGTVPPAFAVMANVPNAVPDRYQRYVVNRLRETFSLRVPIRLFFRERPGREKRESRLQQFRARAAHKRR